MARRYESRVKDGRGDVSGPLRHIRRNLPSEAPAEAERSLRITYQAVKHKSLHRVLLSIPDKISFSAF